MRPQIQANQARTTAAPPHDFAITTEFIRLPVDVDDTVPVDLYSRPYERLEIELAAARPVKREPAPTSPLVLVLTIVLLLGAFVLGFAVPALLL